VRRPIPSFSARISYGRFVRHERKHEVSGAGYAGTMLNITRRIARPLAALALTTAALLPLTSSAQTAPADMDGTWNASSSGMLTKVVIAHTGSSYTLHAFASCTPTPCDWGTKPLTIFAPTAGTPIGKVGMATFPQGFKTATIVVTLNDATSPVLNVQTLTKFAPGDTRSNYAITQSMH